MFDRFESILAAKKIPSAEVLGLSKESRPILGGMYGTGDTRISLIAGAHADEPIGSRFLRHLSSYLNSLPSTDPMLTEFEWWIVPDVNPDGALRNSVWHSEDDTHIDLANYLRYAIREAPGDDIEFGFPRGQDDVLARPENRSLYRWWSEAEGVFHLHGSLHSIHLAAGPWFLIDSAWVARTAELQTVCSEEVGAMGYVLHDVERNGEKGFKRIARGFCTRPHSQHMAQFFLSRGQAEIAARFRPSSMETIRSLGGDPLTIVSEMPLFIAPGIGEYLGPPDLVAERWKTRFEQWRERLLDGEDASMIQGEAASLGLRAMPIVDQMKLQWRFVTAAVTQIRGCIDEDASFAR